MQTKNDPDAKKWASATGEIMINNKISHDGNTVKPLGATLHEAGILYKFMVYGKLHWKTPNFTDKRNAVIYDILLHLKTQLGFYGCSESLLIDYLTEYDLLDKVGGVERIKKIFGGYEHWVRGVVKGGI